ncbi:hypothetical protein BDW22DRAFT_712570 [Trametopsis cervina]|nr:hypothetical protein BDW22DRAFT_712570 [Trametopsis cervina]
MAHSSTTAMLWTLTQEISRLPQNSRPIVCLRQGGHHWVISDDLVDRGPKFRHATQPLRYPLAIKTRLLSLHELLKYTPDNACVLFLDDGFSIPIVENEASLIQVQGYRDHMAAILRDESALVLLCTGSSEAIAAQHREWDRRISRRLLYIKRLMHVSQQTISPSMLSPSLPTDWVPTLDLSYQRSYTKTHADEGLPLPSLPELGSLHGLNDSQDGINSESFREDMGSVYASMPAFPSLPFDWPCDTDFLGSPLSSPSTSTSSSQMTTPSLCLSDISPCHNGTVCLADISPAPPALNDTCLPHDEAVYEGPSSDDHNATDVTPPSRPSSRKIKPLPSRPLPVSPSQSVAGSLQPLEAGKSPRSYASTLTPPRVPATTVTPEFASLRLASSPPIGLKRKSPLCPLGGQRELSASPSAIEQPISKLQRSIKASPAALASDVGLDDGSSDLSDLDGGSEDEGEDDVDDDFELDKPSPPAKKVKVVGLKGSGNKPRAGPKRRNNGRASVSKKRKFSCEDCGRKFTRDADRKRHMESACKNKLNPPIEYRCPMCPSTFSGRSDALRRHISNTHHA